jgi:hypothetical protein
MEVKITIDIPPTEEYRKLEEKMKILEAQITKRKAIINQCSKNYYYRNKERILEEQRERYKNKKQTKQNNFL